MSSEKDLKKALRLLGDRIDELHKALDGSFRAGTQIRAKDRLEKADKLLDLAHETLEELNSLANELRESVEQVEEQREKFSQRNGNQPVPARSFHP